MNMCIEIAELGNKALASCSIYKLSVVLQKTVVAASSARLSFTHHIG